MENSYNLRSPAVKRLMREAEELRIATEDYYAQPMDDNLFEWHFTVRGPSKTDFDDGIYHGRITLPPEYPMKPPSIILLTPNGRFEVNKKICLSISGHHPESWQPSWSIRTALVAIIGFMPTHGNGAIGSLDYTSEERIDLAQKSLSWECPDCGVVKYLLKERESKVADNCEMIPSEVNARDSCTVATSENVRQNSNVDCLQESDIHDSTSNDVAGPSEPRQRLLPKVNEQVSYPETLPPSEATSSCLRFNTFTTLGIWCILILMLFLLLRRLFFL